jgi:hypothetical protein
LVESIILSIGRSYKRPTTNSLQNVFMVMLFGSFVAKSLSTRRKFIHNINGNPNSLQGDKKISFQTYTKSTIYTF